MRSSDPSKAFTLQLTAVTTHPRHAVIAQLTATLNDLGSVLDSHPFSNLALAVQFEISPRGMARLRPALLALPMALSQASLDALNALEKMAPEEFPPELVGSLNITFAHPEPDRPMTIPAVPG